MLQDEEIKLISEETGFSAAQIERLYSRFESLDKGGICGSLSRQDFLRIPELAINPLCDRIVHMFFVDCDADHDRINFRQFMQVLATFNPSHRSSPLSRSRNVSRQESLNHQQQQSILKQAPSLLFDTIDPSPFSPALGKHSRHSSFHDGFNDGHHHHHHHLHAYHHTTNQHSVHYAANFNHQEPLIDPEEPLNSRKRKLYFMFKIYDVNNDDKVDLSDLTAILKMLVGDYVDKPILDKIAARSLSEIDKNCKGFIDFEEFSNAFTQNNLDEDLKVKFSHS